MEEITMKDVMDALNTVYTEADLTYKDVVNLAGAVMPLIESILIDYKLLETLKDQLVKDNDFAGVIEKRGASFVLRSKNYVDSRLDDYVEKVFGHYQPNVGEIFVPKNEVAQGEVISNIYDTSRTFGGGK